MGAVAENSGGASTGVGAQVGPEAKTQGHATSRGDVSVGGGAQTPRVTGQNGSIWGAGAKSEVGAKPNVAPMRAGGAATDVDDPRLGSNQGKFVTLDVGNEPEGVVALLRFEAGPKSGERSMDMSSGDRIGVHTQGSWGSSMGPPNILEELGGALPITSGNV